PAAPSVPAAPSGLSATAVSSNQVNLAWTDNSNNEDGFRVQRCTGASCGSYSIIATLGAGAQSYSDTSVSGGNTYRYQVLAYNGAGNSAPSNTADATTPPPPAVPAAPGNLKASAVSSGQINLSWADNSNNEEGFRIERCQGSGCTNFAQIATVGAGATSYSNTGLSPATFYSYRVRAYNGAGNSGYSNTATARTKLR
ncbi:MAG: fibronectin type III domain-containing protein, partial [Bryobacterales bacterium]|nr:fibronectin type III domain-containing protein [Bryobacterales bacterium]